MRSKSKLLGVALFAISTPLGCTQALLFAQRMWFPDITDVPFFLLGLTIGGAVVLITLPHFLRKIF